MNWFEAMSLAVRKGVLIYDENGITGELSRRQFMLMRCHVECQTRRTKLKTLFVPPGTQIVFPNWYGDSGATCLIGLVGCTVCGVKVKEAPAGLTEMYLASDCSMPQGTVSLVLGECENGEFVLGAF